MKKNLKLICNRKMFREIGSDLIACVRSVQRRVKDMAQTDTEFHKYPANVESNGGDERIDRISTTSLLLCLIDKLFSIRRLIELQSTLRPVFKFSVYACLHFCLTLQFDWFVFLDFLLQIIINILLNYLYITWTRLIFSFMVIKERTLRVSLRSSPFSKMCQRWADVGIEGAIDVCINGVAK